MTRWTIEKSGTGIEKSGTGIEKSGTGIEKSGTGIEKSGTGIEKSGTGIRKGFLAISLAAIAMTSQVNASNISPQGAMQVYVENGQVTVSWYFDGSLYSGTGIQEGTYANTGITHQTLVVGGGTGAEVVGGGTGAEVVGGGTGAEVVGGGTGAGSLVVGGGTGSESITVITNLQFEISLGCQTASVAVLDTNYTEITSFNNIVVMGNTGLCGTNGNVRPAFGAIMSE